jgi:hypothetical protein
MPYFKIHFNFFCLVPSLCFVRQSGCCLPVHVHSSLHKALQPLYEGLLLPVTREIGSYSLALWRMAQLAQFPNTHFGKGLAFCGGLVVLESASTCVLTDEPGWGDRVD